jgi:hypothetical protein
LKRHSPAQLLRFLPLSRAHGAGLRTLHGKGAFAPLRFSIAVVLRRVG